MALFRRRRPDPDLPELDAASADRIRALARQSLQALGISATVDGARVESTLGEFTLEPVARECADQDPRSWPFLVDEVVKRMVRALADGARQLSDATIGRHVVWRLLPDRERMGRSFRRARALSSVVPDGGRTGSGMADEGGAGKTDVVVALAWDGEESLDLLNDAALSQVVDLDAAFAAGRANLTADLAATPAEVAQIADGVVEVSSPSWLTASWALLPAELAARFAPGTAGQILVAAPDHRHLLVGPVDDRASATISRRLPEVPVLAPTVLPF